MAVSKQNSSLFILTEFVNGYNLDRCIFEKIIQDEIRIDNLQIQLQIGQQLVQAVAYMHSQKPFVIHCDIKPANVLIEKSTHTAKLCDMGLSKLKMHQTAITSACTGGARGTPYYMAPECVLDGRSSSRSTDIWSVGITLTELFQLHEAWPIDYDLDDDIMQQVRSFMQQKKMPHEALIISNHPSSKLLSGCLQYDSTQRMSALELSSSFELICCK